MHHTSISGNLGKPAESRFLPDGKPVVTFSVAVKDGKDKTVWWRCSMFGERGEKISQYLTKGTKVAVIGKIQTGENGEPRIWTDKDGKNHASLELTVVDIELMGGGEREQSEAEF